MKAFVHTALVAAGRAWKMKAFARAVLVAAGFGLAVAAPMVPDATAAPAPSVDPDAAEFTIMGHRFRIPRVYLTQAEDLPGRTIESSGDAVFMKVALPNLAPITKRDTDYYKWGEGFTDVISFGLWARPGVAGPIKHYFLPESLKKCTGPREGYLTCPHWLDEDGSNLFKDLEVFVRIDGDRRFAFECHKDDSAPSPQCTIDLAFSDDIELHILFAKKHFRDADRLLARLFELVCSFYLPGPGNKDRTFNYCK
ncbi:MAG: hypothetical protein IIA72_21995 [Proteobacteria bacterium]|nr:hypothetical protein [Pseudomonadota bacterium]